MTSMVERLRLGPGGFVTVPAAGTLNVLGRAFVGRDLLVEGTTYLESYGNLVDDFFSTSVTLPPTANALSAAYRSLSNLVVSRMLANPPFWPNQVPFGSPSSTRTARAGWPAFFASFAASASARPPATPP